MKNILAGLLESLNTFERRDSAKYAPVVAHVNELNSAHNTTARARNTHVRQLPGPKKCWTKEGPFSYLFYLSFKRAFKTRLLYAWICSVEHRSLNT
jgi:hypothetical protein